MKTVSCFLLFAAVLTSASAAPFTEAEITRKVNVVNLVVHDKAKPAATGDMVKGDTAVKTGGDSRAELRFPDATIARLGANTLFTFQPGGREMELGGGTILFAAPKGQGGGQVQAGAITAAVTGTQFLLSLGSDGNVTLVVLEGSVALFYPNNPKERRVYRSGESVTVPAGSLKLPKSVKIDLKRLIATSRLLESGGFGPLPEQSLLVKVADKQQVNIMQNPADVQRTAQNAQTTRRTEDRPGPPSTPQRTPPPKPQSTPKPPPPPHKPPQGEGTPPGPGPGP